MGLCLDVFIAFHRDGRGPTQRFVTAAGQPLQALGLDQQDPAEAALNLSFRYHLREALAANPPAPADLNRPKISQNVAAA